MAAKAKKNIRQEKQSKDTFLNTFSLDKIIPIKYQTIFFLLLILVVFLFYFSPLYFGGKNFQSADITTSHSAITYLDKNKQEEGYTLWNPYVFCGMPAYALAIGFKWFNLDYGIMYVARKIFSFQIPFPIKYATKSAEWAFYLILLAVSVFTFMFRRSNNRLVSFLSGKGI